MEKIKILVTFITWDVLYEDVVDMLPKHFTDADVDSAINLVLRGLPKEFEFETEIDDITDDEEITEAIYDYIDSEFCYCVKNLYYEII